MNLRSKIRHIALAASCFFTFFSVSAQGNKQPKNIIFILADDLGWSDVTLYGKTDFYETPNLERLAAKGLTFTRAYAASPLCSPTRASILTGQTPARTGITAPVAHTNKVLLKAQLANNAAPGSKAIITESVSRLDNELPTLGKLIKSVGYSTAHFGKWHLGLEPYSPLEHGFDKDIPHWHGPGPAGSFVAPWKFPGFKENYPGEHIEDRMTDEAIDWMRQQEKGKPFFLNYWQFSVHAPFDAKEGLIRYYQTKMDLSDPQHSPTYAAMVHSLDQSVGRLLDEVERLGIADETAIIFFSDNGGNMYNGIVDELPSGEKVLNAPTSNRPLRGGKASMYEGGIRVPCIIVWPGLTEPGTLTDALIQSTDFYPTILNQLGIQQPKNYSIDGNDITPILKGEKTESKPIFTYFPHTPKVPDWLPPSVAVHDGDWKLIRLFFEGENGQHDYLLYNLRWDISETINLAGLYPEKVKKLDQMIENHLRDAEAITPAPNPDFDPLKYRPQDIGIPPKGLHNSEAIKNQESR
ncbi:sulfatase [Echinicola sp. 20G]|uniref:sulfatase n=1 Tax=Echinicola sp. 20G TaxID=2781961 RepID=UPI00190FEEE8|nr:sulfatase [Echinicola sp. 20G]